MKEIFRVSGGIEDLNHKVMSDAVAENTYTIISCASVIVGS